MNINKKLLDWYDKNKRILPWRKKSKIDTTYKLSNIIEGISGIKNGVKKHPATKSFHAIRIAINNDYISIISTLMLR